jgi:primosomal protein N'
VVNASFSNPAVDVLVDDSGRLGALAYLVDAEMTLAPGDAVTVPFGKTERHGLVLGPATEPAKASRAVLRRLGQRVDPADMRLAFDLAAHHFASITHVASRLSPSSGRNSAPIDTGEVRLVTRRTDIALPVPERNWAHRLYLRPPLLSPARIAALEALRLSADGQVLVLAPTVKMLEAVLAEFESGASRLDSKARAGSWNGWRSGSVRIGIGTRAAAFYSASRLGGIVVVEEEHPGHLEASIPYLHARDVARRRAALHNCPLSLISASPSAEGMKGCKVVAFDNPGRHWPRVAVASRADLHPTQRVLPPAARSVLSSTTLPIVAVAENGPARRICSRCRDPRPCGDCPGFCNHRPTGECARCGTVGIHWIGWDKPRITHLLPHATPLTLAELAAAPEEPRVVVFMNVDPLLRAASLHPLQDATSVLTRAASAAGRGGTLLLIGDDRDHPVLAGFIAKDAIGLAKGVWDAARAAKLPPFGRLVTLRSSNAAAPKVTTWPGRVFGPRRRAGEWEVLALVSDAELDVLRPVLERLRARGKTRVSVQ